MGPCCSTLSNQDVIPKTPNVVVGTPVVEEHILKEINEAVTKSVAKITAAYKGERIRIVEKMRKAAPERHENLLYYDYPDKNGSKVNELALQNVTSEVAKKKISQGIYEQIKPKLDEKTSGDPLGREALHKVVEKTIEVSVSKAVDATMKTINTNDTEPVLENQ
ncbi:unnamed protein product [Rotaria sordida]|uniref:Uncharacterized protein n=1 Tax=Rotaria sordida TaxID=392033 RepID=A0A814VHM4_9BILA|nr:unnamed protein product [Rotaria sordida]CAF1448339.1 unnamed protein product [Rotaria sordida]